MKCPNGMPSHEIYMETSTIGNKISYRHSLNQFESILTFYCFLFDCIRCSVTDSLHPIQCVIFISQSPRQVHWTTQIRNQMISKSHTLAAFDYKIFDYMALLDELDNFCKITCYSDELYLLENGIENVIERDWITNNSGK